MTRSPDACFGDETLASIYDELDPDRSDLDVYVAMVEEFAARSVLDIGCGTGTFATLLAQSGRQVVGIDPAKASLEVAALKPGADSVWWIHGYPSELPPLQVDMAAMTANVAQVFLTAEAWLATLTSAASAVRLGGRLVFETRIPEAKAWEGWHRDATLTRRATHLGEVTSWTDVLEIALPFVTFRHTYVFESGETLTSESTLRFRSQSEVTEDLLATGWGNIEVRDAPDRPSKEYVFVATKSDGHDVAKPPPSEAPERNAT